MPTNNNTSKPAAPKWEVALSPECWDKWWLYVHLMEGEVGAFMLVDVDASRQTVYVDDLFLVPQSADKSQVDFMTDGLPYAIEYADKLGRLDDLRGCIHSHGDLSTFWSSTDEDMIRKMGVSADWFISCVVNRKGEAKGRIDVFRVEPFGDMHYKLDDLRMYRYNTVETEEAARAELARFVQKPVYPTTKKHKTKALTPYDKGNTLGTPQKDDQSLSYEGQGMWSYVEDGIRFYVDEDGDTVGFSTAVDSDEADLAQMGLGNDMPADGLIYEASDLGENWGRVGEDNVLLWPDGTPVKDQFDCCITEVDVLTWTPLEDLLHEHDVEKVLPYVEAAKQALIAKYEEANAA